MKHTKKIPAQHWWILLPLEYQRFHGLIADEHVHGFDTAYPSHHQESHGRVHLEEFVSRTLDHEWIQRECNHKDKSVKFKTATGHLDFLIQNRKINKNEPLYSVSGSAKFHNISRIIHLECVT